MVTAVKAVGLVETFSGDRPFTVSAPTNEAFAKLPEGTVESLLKPGKKDKLISILTYHFVPAKVMAADVKAGEVLTVSCEKAAISIAERVVKTVGATVITTDIEGANGVIHVIDSVNLPKKSLYRKILSKATVFTGIRFFVFEVCQLDGPCLSNLSLERANQRAVFDSTDIHCVVKDSVSSSLIG